MRIQRNWKREERRDKLRSVTGCDEPMFVEMRSAAQATSLFIDWLHLFETEESRENREEDKREEREKRRENGRERRERREKSYWVWV